MMTPPTTTPGDTLADIRAFVRETMDKWKVPGLALGIAKDGEVLLSEGFGLRNVENALPVTANTLFPIASCTKAFTALSVALMVESGKLEWDKPVRDYMPDFKLADPVVSERITPRDLLCHRSGLPRHDLLWYGSRFSRQEVLRRVRFVEPSRDFRAKLQYQNIMYMAAGAMVGHLAGSSWEAYVKQHVFDRLGMVQSNFSTKETQATANYATPYREKDDQMVAVPFFENDGEHDSTGPAGNIISCADDMVKWVRLNLNRGKHGDVQIISEGNLAQLHLPHVVLDDPGLMQYTGLKLGSYGLGWFIGAFNGEVMIQHGGNIDGFSSLTSILPEHHVGVVVLVNQEASFVPAIVSYTVYQKLLGLRDHDWNAHYREIYDENKKAEKQGKSKSAADRQPNTQPSHPIEAYLGEYEHPGYGVIALRQDGDRLVGALNDKMHFTVTHYHYDIFEFHNEPLDLRVKATFLTDLKGNIGKLTAQLEPAVGELVFTRLPDTRLADRDFLSQFVGTYEWMSLMMTVMLKGDKALVIIIPGQVERALIPYRGTEFLLSGLTGVSVEFKPGEDGAAGSFHEAWLNQPEASITFKRRESE
jgi:CubicO group peptidase (beta-lactamase class C family)